MLGIVINLPPAIETYIAETPFEIMAAHALIAVGWFPIAAVIIWGLLQVWLDKKQGEYWDKLEWDLLLINIPADAVNTPKGMENFFNNLAGSKSAITKREEWIWGKFQAMFQFEIVSNGGKIDMYIRTIKKYRDLVEAALYAQYPEASIVEVEDYVDQIPGDFPHDEYNCFGSEISMKKDHIFPIRTYLEFEHQGEKDLRFKDPLLPMFEILGKMKPGEHFWVQLLIFAPDSQDWRKDGIKWIKKLYGIEESKKKGMIDDMVGWLPRGVMSQVTGMELGGDEAAAAGDDFRMFKITPDERDQLEAVKMKSAQIGWYSKVRVVYVAKHELFRKGTIAAMIKGIFNQFDAGWNKMGMTDSSTPKDDYPWQEWQMPRKQRTLVAKYKGRSFSAGIVPYILSSAELATLFHFPPADARTPVLTTLGARMAEAPGELQYAGDDEEILPNFEPSRPQASTMASPLTSGTSPSGKFQEPQPLVMPTPSAPTQASEPIATTAQPLPSTASPVAEAPAPHMPQPGMPAPLPPGLDLSDEPIDPQDAPSNIPL